jgi:hypothetical protein
MGRMARSHWLAWQVDVPPQDIHPEHSVCRQLARVTDDAVREPAERALAELTAARDVVAAAAGHADRVVAAMARLEATFTRLSGAPATRLAGQSYAGRTLTYEECLRGDTVRLGADALDGIREALALVLDSARWFTIACGAAYAQHFEAAYRQRASELGTDVVPLADWWVLETDALFRERPPFLEPVVRASCGSAGRGCWNCRPTRGGSGSARPTCGSGWQRRSRPARFPGRRPSIIALT